MLIFGNPLGIKEFDHAVTLVHSDRHLSDSHIDLAEAHILSRSTGTSYREFSCCRHIRDYKGRATILTAPFPTPDRDTRTRPRGRFTLPLSTMS